MFIFIHLSQSNDLGKMHNLGLSSVSGEVEALPVETVAKGDGICQVVFVKYFC